MGGYLDGCFEVYVLANLAIQHVYIGNSVESVVDVT